MPARSGGSKLVVVNLRNQPVEIHHGDEVVVVPPNAQTELPVVRAGGEHLAELARQGLVSVQSLKSAEGAAGAKRPRTAAVSSRSTSARKKRPRARAKPPKSPEGGS